MSFSQKYALNRLIGNGGFSKVHQCTLLSSGQFCAVKVSRKRALMPHDVVHAQTEARILHGLSHPRIVAALDVFESDNTLYLVLELVQGGPLLQKIVELDHYTEQTAATLMKNVLLGVEYLHQHGVAHRDLKPENLMLVRAADDELDLTNIKIIDFGFAATFVPGQPSFTEYLGSVPYLAPEIVRLQHGGREPYDEKCDIWALGVLSFILLCGCYPFMGDTVAETHRYILEAGYQFSRPVWSSISSDAKAFISRLLIVDPSQRPSAAEALQDPWVRGAPAVLPSAGEHLEDTLHTLHDFNARAKIRGVFHATLAVCRLRRMLALHRAAVRRAPAVPWWRSPCCPAAAPALPAPAGARKGTPSAAWPISPTSPLLPGGLWELNQQDAAAAEAHAART